jgi:hypothetical protein
MKFGGKTVLLLFFLHRVFPPNFIQILYMVLKKDSGNLAVRLLLERVELQQYSGCGYNYDLFLGSSLG